MKIIAFSGRKQSGKSTAGEFLQKINKNVEIYAFADRLKKDICINMLGMSHDQCYGSDDLKNTQTDIVWDNKKLTAREVMEIVGTDIFRKLKKDVWVSSTINLIKKEKPDVACIVDVRFPDEVDAIHNIGGKVVRLTRDPFNSNNSIECALDACNYDWKNFDFILDNSNIDVNEKNKVLQDLSAYFF